MTKRALTERASEDESEWTCRKETRATKSTRRDRPSVRRSTSFGRPTVQGLQPPLFNFENPVSPSRYIGQSSVHLNKPCKYVGRGNDSEGPRSSGKREEGKRMTGSREEKKEQGGCEVEGWGRERGWKSREREGRREKESVYRLPRNATSRTGAPTCTNTSAAKKAWALYIMIRHFGITTKRAALSHAFLCRRILHLGHVVATQRWKLE